MALAYLLFLAGFNLSGFSASAETAVLPVLPEGVRFQGTPSMADGVFQAAAGPVVLVWEAGAPVPARLTLEVRLSEASRYLSVRVAPDVIEPVASPAPICVTLGGDASGCYVTVYSYKDYNPKGPNTPGALNFYYSPWHGNAAEREALARTLVEKNVPTGVWKDRWVPLAIDWRGDGSTIWLEGLAVAHRPIDARRGRTVTIEFPAGSQGRTLAVKPLPEDRFYVPLDLTHNANALGKSRLPVGVSLEADNVPFELSAGEAADHLSLRRAEWIEWREDPASYYENYDSGPSVLRDPRMPFLRVPKADYVAAHLLARAVEEPHTDNLVTMRVGVFSGGHGQVRQWDFTARVPRISDRRPVAGAKTLPKESGPWFHVRLPWPEALAQDIVGDLLEIELTKEVRLARHFPDPNRFRLRPLGLASAVEIAALTLEKSPLQMQVSSQAPGHVFVAPAQPVFQVTLTNITERPQRFRLDATARHWHGAEVLAKRCGLAAGGETQVVALALDARFYGYYDLEISLRVKGRNQPLLHRITSFACLPPDKRRFRDRSPFGTWDFGATHFGNPNGDSSAALHAALGLRWSFLGPFALREKYGLARGIEPTIHGSIEHFAKTMEENPDQTPVGLIFHENAISYDHIVRVPDLFTDWPPYRFNEGEQKHFDELWEQAIQGARAFREQFPKARISFGNGTVGTREAFYRRGLPAELFDYAGNESAVFSRPPEAQPPDFVANNASLWMDRMLLDHYGYRDKTAQQCYESCYVNTNPGNVGLADQADYYVRHCLHALAWKIPTIRYGMINDVSNSYYFSNWGASGFLNRYPELNPKPAYVAMATLTRVLDGAEFVMAVDAGSLSVYLFEFRRPGEGGRVWAAWTLRGTRPLHLRFAGEAHPIRIDAQGQELRIKPRKGAFEVLLSPSPIYLVAAAALAEVRPGTPTYADRPQGKLASLSRLDDLAQWRVERERDPVLEFYGMTTPRRQGLFRFEIAESYGGRRGVLRVIPQPIGHGKPTMPMYMALRHNTGIPVPGRPQEIGLWIHGNSGWGRVIFELEDPKGQRWTNIGAPATDPLPHWFTGLIPDDLRARYFPMTRSDWNTEDVAGISRINFDGWRYVGFPLPGQYPGEGYPWPANSQWRHDKDGKVQYPLRLTRLIVELQEKVLHATSFVPPTNPEIALADLVACTREP